MRRSPPGAKPSRVARSKRLLSCLLALLLFVQTGVAVAHCLRGTAADQPLLAEVCGPEGKRTVALGPGGEPLEAPEPDGELGFCPACHGLPQVLLPAPPAAEAALWRLVAPSWHGHGSSVLLPAARASPYATRAPPALS